jgi:FtsZ-binding cell division protein ZapB
MTDEERQKLCEIFSDNTTTIYPHHLKEAADEIERLVADNKRLKQERDAWEHNCRAMGWAEAND